MANVAYSSSLVSKTSSDMWAWGFPLKPRTKMLAAALYHLLFGVVLWLEWWDICSVASHDRLIGSGWEFWRQGPRLELFVMFFRVSSLVLVVRWSTLSKPWLIDWWNKQKQKKSPQKQWKNLYLCGQTKHQDVHIYAFLMIRKLSGCFQCNSQIGIGCAFLWRFSVIRRTSSCWDVGNNHSGQMFFI